MSMITFDDFEIDQRNYQLRQNGQPVQVEPRVLDLLLEFVRNPGKLLSREQLIIAVWDGRVVSDSTISTAIKSARKALGDSGEHQRYIKTVHGRGFQFVGELAQSSAKEPTRYTSECPILYLHVASHEDAFSTHQVRALNNRLRVVLNRIPLLHIAAPIEQLGQSFDTRILYTQYHITHCAQVDVLTADDNLIADVTLTDTQSGLYYWTRTFNVKNVAGAQEVLLHQIVGQLEPVILRAMVETYSNQGSQVSAQALTLQAIATLALKGWNKDSFNAVEKLLDDAISQNKSIAVAYAYSALVRALAYRVGINRDQAKLKTAIQYAEKALALENQDSFVVGIAGCALCDAGQLQRGLPLLKRAAALDPSNGHALTALGAANIMLNAFEEAVVKLRQGISISPADNRLAVWEALLAMAELACNRVNKALEAAQSAVARDDRNYLSRLALASVEAAASNVDGLQHAVHELLRVHPGITIDEIKYFAGVDLQVPIWRAIKTARELK